MKASEDQIFQLWKRVCAADDRKAFEMIFELLFNRLIKFCTYYVTRREIAEEIVSDIFVKCWEHRNAETIILKPETYLFSAVRNQSLKYIKKNSGIHLIEIESSEEFMFTDRIDLEKEFNNKELYKQLDEAIEKLSPQSRIIFRLVKENGMRYKEVAEILHISPRTVQTQLFRGIAKLRVLLQPYYLLNYQMKPIAS